MPQSFDVSENTSLSVEELVAFEQIRQLKARFGRLQDVQRWGEFRELFVDDAVLELGLTATTPDEVIAELKARLQDAVTLHHSHSPELCLTSATHARGIWATQVTVERVWRFGGSHAGSQAGPQGESQPASPTAFLPSFVRSGFYEDEYRRVGQVWRIEGTRLITHHMRPMAPRIGSGGA